MRFPWSSVNSHMQPSYAAQQRGADGQTFALGTRSMHSMIMRQPHQKQRHFDAARAGATAVQAAKGFADSQRRADLDRQCVASQPVRSGTFTLFPRSDMPATKSKVTHCSPCSC